MPVFVLVLFFLRVSVFMPVLVLVSVSSAWAWLCHWPSGSVATTQQHQHNSNIATTTAALRQQRWHNIAATAARTVDQQGEHVQNSWAIHATNSQSLVTHMVWGPWGPKTHGIHNFLCVFNNKQAYSILPKGSQGLPPKCSLMRACW